MDLRDFNMKKSITLTIEEQGEEQYNHYVRCEEIFSKVIKKIRK